MDATNLQTALTARHLDPGPPDGILGRKTLNATLEALTHRQMDVTLAALALAMSKLFPERGIDSRLRVIHFLAQAAHETGGFHYLTELGSARYLARYDGRRDLGNVKEGDGARFRGRGIFQITGRANYKTYGEKLGVNLLENPALAAEPAIAVGTAVLYWNDHRLSALADADDTVGITRKINGGVNGLDDRQRYVATLKALWPG